MLSYFVATLFLLSLLFLCHCHCHCRGCICCCCHWQCHFLKLFSCNCCLRHLSACLLLLLLSLTFPLSVAVSVIVVRASSYLLLLLLLSMLLLFVVFVAILVYASPSFSRDHNHDPLRLTSQVGECASKILAVVAKWSHVKLTQGERERKGSERVKEYESYDRPHTTRTRRSYTQRVLMIRPRLTTQQFNCLNTMEQFMQCPFHIW